MRDLLAVTAATVLLTAQPVSADRTPSGSRPWPSETVRYRCEGDVELQVAYLNPENGEAHAALYHDGRLSLMRIWPAASGARYVSIDEQVGLRWHTKGEDGMLSFLAADHTAEEQTLLSDCRAIAPDGD